MTATISESCGQDDNNNNNINSQITIKNRLSPAQINTGKWVRLLNIIIQEQVSLLSEGGRGMHVLRTISQHDCLSVFVITTPPSVALKNVPGLQMSSHSTTDKQNSHESHCKGCHFVFFDKWLEALYVGSSFFVLLFEARGTTVLTVSVYARGGIYVHSAACSEKQYWHSDLSQSGWVWVSEWQTESKKTTQRWSEERMMGVVRDEAESWRGHCCHFSADTHRLDGVNRKVVSVCLRFKTKLREWVTGWEGGEEGPAHEEDVAAGCGKTPKSTSLRWIWEVVIKRSRLVLKPPA